MFAAVTILIHVSLLHTPDKMFEEFDVHAIQLSGALDSGHAYTDSRVRALGHGENVLFGFFRFLRRFQLRLGRSVFVLVLPDVAPRCEGRPVANSWLVQG